MQHSDSTDTVLALFSTGKNTGRPGPTAAHVAWEQQAITAIDQGRYNSWVADIGVFLSGQLRREYGLDPGHMS
ncbi:hypothetical protein [Streptomyces syringium]|uniref:hypothetical protein n=1 Tax=Streptomyces syringium TaxID=76729 RepID=UPI00345208B1